MFEIREVDYASCWKFLKEVPELDAIELGAIKQRLGTNHYLALLAESNQKTLGFHLGYEINSEVFYLWLAGVNPQAREQGVFQKLYSYFEVWSKNSGYKTLQVKSMNRFRPMLHFLLKNEFSIVAVGSDKKILFEKKL